MGLDHFYVAQVDSLADGTKIMNTGTTFRGDPVGIFARPLRPLCLRRSRRLPRAQVNSATTEITVSDPGKAVVFVRDPRPSRPPARKRRNETQAIGVSVTFKCYGADATATGSGNPGVPGTPALCDGS